MSSRVRTLLFCLLVAALSPPALSRPAGEGIRIGSKKFTESVILGEMLALLARDAGAEVEHIDQLGGTRILWNALRAGEIDAYPEYTGTISGEILAGRGLSTAEAIRDAVEAEGLRMSPPIGFDNTYAIGMVESRADALGVRRISDLRDHGGLRLAFTNEFMKRDDGWPGLRDRYRLPHDDVDGLDHDVAYRGLLSGTIDVTDFYSTDAEIAEHGLRVLEDDLRYFPRYEAVILYRADLAQRAGAVVEAMLRLAGRIDARTMASLNARAKIARVPESVVASEFLLDALGVDVPVRVQTMAERIARRTGEHLALVGISLAAAIIVSVPLGVVAAKRPRLGQVILGVTGVLQTIPSLALLVFMIPILGVGEGPAVAALFLYSLLPIVRNTHSGLREIPVGITESARALGLPPATRLRVIELPLATGSILAGIKTSGVINVGTATLGALIGAGGYGQPILTGIRLDSVPLILEGAVPAAVMAVGVQWIFERAERRLVPRGLRVGK